VSIRIGINGFGRIGRSYLRAALRSTADVEVVAINDVADAATLGSLLEWDSLAGTSTACRSTTTHCSLPAHGSG
jgi:glyceraldehyde 3-phosphate dehydrogenase